MKRIGFYGGSFDPVHNGHLTIAQKLVGLFAFDEFYFVPAFHAPHKKAKKVSSAFCRYAMLALATQNEIAIKISTLELEAPERPYTIESLTKLKKHYGETANIFFVMGADSWNEINTWRKWDRLLLMTNFVVVTRPHFEFTTGHVTPEIAARICDLRGLSPSAVRERLDRDGIFVTDVVQMSVSATKIRQAVALQNDDGWRKLVALQVADYIEKYQLYQ